MEELKVTVEEPGAVRRAITVEVAAADVIAGFAAMLREYRRKAVQPGFRKGKVPADIIRRLYWGDITSDVARALIGESYPAALDKVGLDPVAEPEFEILTLEEDQPFTYKATVEVKPRFEPAGYTGIEVPGESVEVADEEVGRLIEEIRQSHATVKKIEEARGLRDGDVAVISFEGTAGGAAIPGGSGKDFPVTLGGGSFPPGFEDNLIGATAGETREFTIKLPEQFSDPALAGKEALFTVTVSEVRERILPALDDEFAKDVGEYQGLEDLRAKVRENIRRTKEVAARGRVRDAVGRRLAELHPIEVPPTMLERRRESLIAEAERYLVMRGMPWAEVQKTRAQIREDAGPAAERRVRISLVLEAIAAREGITVGEEELAAEIGKIAAANKLEPAEVRRRLVENGSLAGLAASLLEDKALEWVAERAKMV
ncbi:MAG TPA: trigger factor [bacterium]